MALKKNEGNADDDDDDDDIRVAAAGFYISSITRVRRKNKRHLWARPLLSKRKLHDGCELLVVSRNDDVELSGKLRSIFKVFISECQAKISRILCLVDPAVTKKETNFREAVSVTERLAMTLRYPSSVDSYLSV